MKTDILHIPESDVMQTSAMGKLISYINKKYTLNLENFKDLHSFSINQTEQFWDTVSEDLGIIFSHKGERIIDNLSQMIGGQFFVDSTLNFAQNLLKQIGKKECLIYWSEDKIKEKLSWDEIRQEVSKLQQYLKSVGIGQGDVVAGFVPNCPQAIIAMLATTSLGGVWTSCSPDFGIDGALDRFGQTRPKVIFTADGYYYNSKFHDSITKISEIVGRINNIQKCIIFNHTGHLDTYDTVNHAVIWEDILQDYAPVEIMYVPVAFNDPVFIMYSSGTTGQPKCIVHGVGGTLISNMIETVYHSDININSVVFFYSTCGWMMWNWLVGSLATSATLLLFDGSPFKPTNSILFDFMEQEKATFMGVSAKYIDFLIKTDISPIKTHIFPNLKTLGSTGSVLSPEAFSWIAENVKHNVYISSLSGGTDILGCFIMGNPLSPVYKGELVGPVLGKAVEIWDDNGKPIKCGTGELMCVKSFPAMPIYFWNDVNKSRYRSTYFNKFRGKWCHGDFVEVTQNGGYIIKGRSDSVLNPGGVRIGTSEIYRQVDSFEDILESVVIGQPWEGDVRIILFVRMKGRKILNQKLIDTIKLKIKTRCTSRHIPAKIIQVNDIPKTRSGKISELAVRNMVCGRKIKNVTALVNPESLKLYENLG